MYKAHPDWIIKKVKPVEGEEELTKVKKSRKSKKGAAAEEDEDASEVPKKKKRITDMEVTGDEVNPLDCAQLDLRSEEIGK